MKSENLKQGAFFVLVASIAYSVMGLFVKWSAKEATNEQMVFMRNFVCLLLLLPFIFFPKVKNVKTTFLPIHLMRGIFGMLNMYCFFYSINYILLADAMLLNNTMPLFVPFVVWIWTKKKISPSLIPGLVIGFLGIIFVLRPTEGLFQPAALFALASGLFMSVSMAGIRELGKEEPTYKILFYYFCISSFISFFPFLWTWKEIPFLYWIFLICIGVSAMIYQYFLTLGYQKASASKISPIIYFAVILSAFFDWIIWNKTPSWITFVGVVLVCIGAILTLRSEAK